MQRDGKADLDIRDGKLFAGGLAAGELIPYGDVRLQWRGDWPEVDPRSVEGLVDYIEASLYYIDACDKSERLYEQAKKNAIASSTSAKIGRTWPSQSPIDAIEETLSNVNLMIDHLAKVDLLIDPPDGISAAANALRRLKQQLCGGVENADASEIENSISPVDESAMANNLETTEDQASGLAEEKADSADSKADNGNNSQKIPENPRVLQLVKKLQKELPVPGNTQVSIARDFCDGRETEAKGLLRQIRRFPDFKSLVDAAGKQPSKK